MSNFDTEKTTKHRKKAKRTNGSFHFHVCTGGGWAREIGTIVLLAFFSPSFIAFFGPCGGNPCSEASCGVVTFSLVLKAFQVVLGLGTPNSPFVLFRSEYGLFKLPKHYVLKGRWPILKRKMLYNRGKNAKRTNGTHFTRVRGRGWVRIWRLEVQSSRVLRLWQDLIGQVLGKDIEHETLHIGCPWRHH